MKLDGLQDELVNLTTKNENLASELKELGKTRQQLTEMTSRYSTALDLLGEKEEQVEECKADIQDLKVLYKNQINELLEQIDKLKKK